MVDPAVITALLSTIPSLAVAIISIVLNNRVIGYKVDALQKKVDKHNSMVERTYKLESDMATVWRRYDDMSDRVERIEEAKNG